MVNVIINLFKWQPLYLKLMLLMLIMTEMIKMSFFCIFVSAKHTGVAILSVCQKCLLQNINHKKRKKKNFHFKLKSSVFPRILFYFFFSGFFLFLFNSLKKKEKNVSPKFSTLNSPLKWGKFCNLNVDLGTWVLFSYERFWIGAWFGAWFLG